MKVATDRNETPVANTPYGLSESERKIWWSIATACTSTLPSSRPTMEAVQRQLSTLRISLKGCINFGTKKFF